MITTKSKRLERKRNIVKLRFGKVFFNKVAVCFDLSLTKKCLKVKGIRYFQRFKKIVNKKLFYKALPYLYECDKPFLFIYKSKARFVN